MSSLSLSETLSAAPSHEDGRLTELCVGTNLRVASLEFIEVATAAARDLETGPLGPGRGSPECIVLGTCNRVEVYAAVQEEALQETVQKIRGRVFRRGADEQHGADPVYVHEGTAAVRHLCLVAAGLDSIVLGEHEIAGQVSAAFAGRPKESAHEPTFGLMAAAARKASSRARRETGIGHGRVSLSAVAVDLVERELGSLSGKTVLVIGAGKVARLACAALRGGGHERLVIANRTASRAQDLAARFGGHAASLDQLTGLLATSDVVLTTTASETPILTSAVMARALADRGSEGDLLVVDLAVPRDVEPGVDEHEGVRVQGLEHLKALSESNLQTRRLELNDASAIVEEEVAAYEQVRDRGAAGPLLRKLWQNAEDIRATEVERQFGQFEDLDPDTRARIEHLSRSLVNKILHQPSAQLRSVSGNGQFAQYSCVIAELFDLDRDGPLGHSE